ncbi:MAG: hypothetical protein ACP5I1_09640, partial [Candidatus Hinthialibacter sp.]
FSPLELMDVTGRVIDSLGVDAVEVEGFLRPFDLMENQVVGDLKELVDVLDGVPVNIYFSFEENNEEYFAGSGSLLTPGTKVSADDLIRLHIS